jgi:small subunit ribosomal protein S16
VAGTRDPDWSIRHTVATKIKLMRLGKMRAPYYRIVVADARTKRDGRSIETIGKYHPKEDPSFIEVDAERVAYWLGVGAQPTEAVEAILKVTGDWQQFKGLPAPPPMKVKEAKRDKKELFNEVARASVDGAAEKAATTPKAKKAAKPAADKAETPATPATPATEAPAAEAAAPAETPTETVAPVEASAADTAAAPAADTAGE